MRLSGLSGGLFPPLESHANMRPGWRERSQAHTLRDVPAAPAPQPPPAPAPPLQPPSASVTTASDLSHRNSLVRDVMILHYQPIAWERMGRRA